MCASFVQLRGRSCQVARVLLGLTLARLCHRVPRVADSTRLLQLTVLAGQAQRAALLAAFGDGQDVVGPPIAERQGHRLLAHSAGRPPLSFALAYTVCA